ncbi:MAG: homoserine O-acetyltransferase [Candidatus Aureabacteria bacterium]|nr:homoserine O-acetyltransferase [Candidatus Auribacterota bacterium]
MLKGVSNMEEKGGKQSVGLVKPETVTFDSVELECGRKLSPVDVCYETYGRLNSDKDNAVLVAHALSGDAHAAGLHSDDDKKPGWWDIFIGPGKGIDTDKYFVICSNIIGGCKGSSGPGSINKKDNKPYGTAFPPITVRDMVTVQKRLIDHLGIKSILAVIGGSLGGMQVLQWAVDYPAAVKSAIVIASTAKLSAQGIAFNAVGREAITSDPNWFKGDYYDKGKKPEKGLAIARMIGHITYLSEDVIEQKFGRKTKSDKDTDSGDFPARVDFTQDEYEIESYLSYQGDSFVKRFDANSYLYISKAMDAFDLYQDYGSLEKAFKNVKSGFLVVSYTSDWLFPAWQSKEIVKALKANNIPVTYYNIKSESGHDSFLVEKEISELEGVVSPFLDNIRGG